MNTISAINKSLTFRNKANKLKIVNVFRGKYESEFVTYLYEANTTNECLSFKVRFRLMQAILV